jgi:hypothetical protein
MFWICKHWGRYNLISPLFPLEDWEYNGSKLMLCLFRRKIFFGVWLIRKNTNGEKSWLTRFRHWSAEFRPLSSDFGYCCRISAMEAGIRQQWLDSVSFAGIWHNKTGFWRWWSNVARSGGPVLDSSMGQFLAYFIEFWRSDTKIRGPSAVDSGYQQNPMPCYGRFL